jgi:hypothetical protein
MNSRAWGKNPQWNIKLLAAKSEAMKNATSGASDNSPFIAELPPKGHQPRYKFHGLQLPAADGCSPMREPKTGGSQVMR